MNLSIKVRNLKTKYMFNLKETVLKHNDILQKHFRFAIIQISVL